ncbi:MAG: hypothetical protein J0H88_03060 [Sphingomonadales bacterium]|nr:hypothetical protein [Sphingomonadales bacterium]
MAAGHYFKRLIVPGLVIQAVMVGGGYATGRELVEFFLSMGAANGLLGIAVTALLFSLSCMTAFELARTFRAYDYFSLCRQFLGPFAFLFEAGYLAALLLALAVVSAAAGVLSSELVRIPEMFGSMLFMALVAGIACFGSHVIEKLISIWSLIFYLAYGGLFFLVLSSHGGEMRAAIGADPIEPARALWNGVSYASYNITVVAILIFVARNFATRREALIAGAIAGPLILLPGIALLLTLSAFSGLVLTAELPVSVVLGELGIPAFALLVKLIILGALIKTGVGLLHGLNERVARASVERGLILPRWGRPALALFAMLLALYGANRVGLIDLIGQGYRYSAVFFFFVFLAPLLTLGVWRLIGQRGASSGSDNP